MKPAHYNDLLNNLDLQLYDVFENEHLAPHTTFRIGGPADIFILPKNIQAFSELLQQIFIHHIPYKIIGNASNLLVRDSGFKGIVVCTKLMNEARMEETVMYAESGASLASCASLALKNACSGFEKIGGIPGTVGGALAMNAGAFGMEISNILSSVTVFDKKKNTIRTLSHKELEFGYRCGPISDKGLIVLHAEFQLQKSCSEEILEEMHSCMEKRKLTQPLNFPSAGSVFKRPPNDYAGRLIETAGLKGVRIGDAEVSTKHAGFIINRGHATAKDVCSLIELIQKKVRENSDVLLLCELEILSEG